MGSPQAALFTVGQMCGATAVVVSAAAAVVFVTVDDFEAGTVEVVFALIGVVTVNVAVMSASFGAEGNVVDISTKEAFIEESATGVMLGNVVKASAEVADVVLVSVVAVVVVVVMTVVDVVTGHDMFDCTRRFDLVCASGDTWSGTIFFVNALTHVSVLFVTLLYIDDIGQAGVPEHNFQL